MTRMEAIGEASKGADGQFQSVSYKPSDKRLDEETGTYISVIAKP